MALMSRRIPALVAVLTLVAAACGGTGGPLPEEEARSLLAERVADIGPRTIAPPPGAPPGPPTEFCDTLPDIDNFELTVDPPRGSNSLTVEIFSSTEKSGSDTNGWLVEVARDFNSSRTRLADGREVLVQIRAIPSGTAFLYMSCDEYIPDGFTPSNHLWVRMAEAFDVETRAVQERLVSNTAGIIMLTETAERLEADLGSVDAASLVAAVSRGDVVMGYTNPLASSTGLNFLSTVLLTFAGGDPNRMTDADVASSFEQFQSTVPFVALTTLQLLESIEKEGGTLDAGVMEWQTFTNSDRLRDGWDFFPFGVAHDNPLYATGDTPADVDEALDLFGAFATSDDAQRRAREVGFDPPPYTPAFGIPPGKKLVEAQQLWQDTPTQPVAAVFVADVSGSMDGARINALRRALQSGADFISSDNSIGIVTFNDQVQIRLPVAPFDQVNQGRLDAVVQSMRSGGGTAMYDGILVGLDMVLAARDANPDVRPLVFVLTDGQTTDGNGFDDVNRIIEGLGIPVHTIGFEADIDELTRLSNLVEAANINADVDDVVFRIASMFNSEL
jgi:Ca-activated chloride channel family protein